MSAPYQLTSGTSICRTLDGASIPPDPDNSDYKKYLAWLAAENTPDSYIPPAPGPLRQSARVVLDRLTNTELNALRDSTNILAIRSLETARIEGVISEADPDFESMKNGLNALGIILSPRWADLLAP